MIPEGLPVREPLGSMWHDPQQLRHVHPEALGSPSGYVVPTGYRLLRPHVRLWIPPRCLWFRGGGCCTKGKRLKVGIQRVPNLLRWTVLACCLPYPGDPKSAIDCFFLFGISLHPGVTGSVPHWKFRGCRVHSFPSPQELLRPASWLALLSRTFTFELAPTRSPSISVEYDYVDKQSIPTAGLSPASPTALWAAGHRISPPDSPGQSGRPNDCSELSICVGASPRVAYQRMFP